jgi:hypothetical protein
MRVAISNQLRRFYTPAGTGFARASVRHAGITCLPIISMELSRIAWSISRVR